MGVNNGAKKSHSAVEVCKKQKTKALVKLFDKNLRSSPVLVPVYPTTQGESMSKILSGYIADWESTIIDDVFSEVNCKDRTLPNAFTLDMLKESFASLLIVFRKCKIDEQQVNESLTIGKRRRKALQWGVSLVTALNRRLLKENETVNENFKRYSLEKKTMLEVLALLQIRWDLLCNEENPLDGLDSDFSLTISDTQVVYPSLDELHAEILAMERHFKRLSAEVEQLRVSIQELTNWRSELLMSTSNMLHFAVNDLITALQCGFLEALMFAYSDGNMEKKTNLDGQITKSCDCKRSVRSCDCQKSAQSAASSQPNANGPQATESLLSPLQLDAACMGRCMQTCVAATTQQCEEACQNLW
ncbi:hypothetical protein Tcan_07040 [Toxocara canis]|uniref:Uncharacterized protein n=1 Tax=Toxocara canis TaxID=6265 RepID=A0A0B2V1E6_TOXCA|nr:hypothetical protein Tcan_07040 [Toxocara canis]